MESCIRGGFMELASQMTLFEKTIEEKLIEQELRRGSNVEGGKERIIGMYRKLTRAERVRAIKNEYGIGGWGGPNLSSVSFDSKGLKIRNGDMGINLTWEQVEKQIEKMIVEGRY